MRGGRVRDRRRPLASLLGTITGLLRVDHREAVEPTLQAVRSIPTLAWAPLLLLWLGIGEAPKVTLVAIGAFFPRVRQPRRGRAGRRPQAGRGRPRSTSLSWPADRAAGRCCPASLPQSLLTGLRLGFSQAWLFVVVAELYRRHARAGLPADRQEENLSRVDLMVVAMLALAIFGKLSDMLLRGARGAGLLGWRDTFEGRPGVSQLLAIRGLRKRYGDVGRAVSGLGTSTSAHGEIVALVGPSGCGKSTLLRLIKADRGETKIVVGSQPVRGPSHAVGLVFQEPRLFPWLSVADNVGFGLGLTQSPMVPAHLVSRDARGGWPDRVLESAARSSSRAAWRSAWR